MMKKLCIKKNFKIFIMNDEKTQKKIYSIKF